MWFLVLFMVSAFVAIYAYFQYKYTFWQRMGIPTPRPQFPFGNHNIALGRQTGFHNQAFYNQLKDAGTPYFGTYFAHKPVAVASSLDMVKNVLIKDFAYFTDRGVYHNEKLDPLSAHLFAVDGDKWHMLRHRLTPTFTSGKMKFMYPTMIEVAQRFNQCIARTVLAKEEPIAVDVKELLARFTTDVIGTCAFGIECNSLDDPNTVFRTMGRKAFNEPRHKAFVIALIREYPTIARWLGMKMLRDDVSSFFMNVVRDTVAHREANLIERNDFMDLLIKMKNDEKVGISIEEIAAQAFVFFLAGFETSSTTMLFALYELALSQEVQGKAREEIIMVLSKHGGKFTYEAMMEMHYVEQVINETLRKYPTVSQLTRQATRDYPVPNTKSILPRNTTVIIPAYAIHHDPDIYPNPEAFQPERFSAEERATRPNVAFLPFGEGPRNCVGARFGMMQSRVGLVTLLLNYEFTPNPLTPVPMVYDMSSFILTPANGMWLNMTRISQDVDFV